MSDGTVTAYVHARDAAAAAAAVAEAIKKKADAAAAKQRPYRKDLARRHRNSLLAMSARLQATDAPADPFVWHCYKVARDLKFAAALHRRAMTEHAALCAFLRANGTPAPGYLNASSATAPTGEEDAPISELIAELDEWIVAAQQAGRVGAVQAHLEAHHLLLSRRFALTEIAEREVRTQVVELWDCVARLYAAKSQSAQCDADVDAALALGTPHAQAY